jgi:Tol biopolymer transport system component
MMVTALTVACSLLLAQSSRAPEVEFKAAQHKEEVEGDLKGAIKQYEKISKGKDRALAAKALLRMAGVHQKLGDAEAEKIYEHVARAFGDQKELAAEAQTRLASLRVSQPSVAGVMTREVKVEFDNPFGRPAISSDGRYLVEENGGAFVLHDLKTGSNRTWKDSGGAASSFFSRDGTQLAYKVYASPVELRIVNLQSAGDPQPKKLYSNPDVDDIEPHDWTPDGKWIVVSLTRKDGSSQIGLVSASDGSLNLLKSVDHWPGPTHMFLTPDGKYLAFDLPAGDTVRQRDIYVLSLDEKHEEPVVTESTNDVVMGWTPDGKYLLYASERTPTGAKTLWALPIAQGKAQGVPRIIKPDIIGDVSTLGVTASGALYLAMPVQRDTYIRLATFDFNTEQFIAPPATSNEFIGGNPRWSHDGSQVMYRSSDRGLAGESIPTLTIRSVESGRVVRELRPLLQSTYEANWAPEGRFLIVSGRDFRGHCGIYRIDVETEAMSQIGEERSCNGSQVVFTDGIRIYHSGRQGQLLMRDLSTGKDDVLYQSSAGFILSPDGQFVALLDGALIKLISTAGGQPRELIRANTILGWAPDSRSLLAFQGQDVLRVSLDGQAHKVNFNLRGFSSRGLETNLNRISIGSRQIAYTQQRVDPVPTMRMIVIENFLPLRDVDVKILAPSK